MARGSGTKQREEGESGMTKQPPTKGNAPGKGTIIAFPANGLPRTPRTVALAKLMARITTQYVRQAA